MTNIGTKCAALLIASLGVFPLLSVDVAAAQRRERQPPETVLMHGIWITLELSAKCERYIDRTFGRGTGAGVHPSAAFAACIENPADF